MIDFKALAAKAQEQAPVDMTKAQAGGGGDYEPPAEGMCYLRLVGVYFLGKQKGTFKGAPTVKDKVRLVFEVSGPKHKPRVTDDGKSIPHLITVDENYSLSEKARFFKLFQVLNYSQNATHIVELLADGGAAYKARIIHRKYKRNDGKEGIAVELYNKTAGAYTIEPPRRDEIDPDTQEPTGNQVTIKVPEAITPRRCFLWDMPDMDQWNSIFIEGEYPERKNDKGEVTAKAKSKNALQNLIKSATNWVGSPMYLLLASSGGNLDVPEAEAPETDDSDDDTQPAAKPGPAPVPQGQDADDALNGVV